MNNTDVQMLMKMLMQVILHDMEPIMLTRAIWELDNGPSTRVSCLSRRHKHGAHIGCKAWLKKFASAKARYLHSLWRQIP